MAKKTNSTTDAKVEAAQAAGLPKVTGNQIESAQKEGIKEAEKEAAADSYRYATDGNLANDTGARQFTGKDEIMQYAGLIDLGLDEFKDRIDADADEPIPEEKVAGLLELERSGQNRTGYVQAMCKRLGVKSPYEVTNAGPGYTNDTSAITEVAR